MTNSQCLTFGMQFNLASSKSSFLWYLKLRCVRESSPSCVVERKSYWTSVQTYSWNDLHRWTCNIFVSLIIYSKRIENFSGVDNKMSNYYGMYQQQYKLHNIYNTFVFALAANNCTVLSVNKFCTFLGIAFELEKFVCDFCLILFRKYFKTNIASILFSYRSVRNWRNKSCCSFFIYLQIAQNIFHFLFDYYSRQSLFREIAMTTYFVVITWLLTL